MVSSTPLVAYLHTAMSGGQLRAHAAAEQNARQNDNFVEDKSDAGGKGAVVSLRDAGHGDPTLRVLPQLKILA
jgi:hypothetical protein